MKTVIFFFILLILRAYRKIVWYWKRASYRTSGVKLSPGCQLVTDSYGKVLLGCGTVVAQGAILIATTEHSISHTGILKVGENTVINEYSNLRASGGVIDIGNKCMIAQHVSIIATNHEIDNINGFMIDHSWSESKASVKIGNDVWIGCGAIILPGVEIGDGAVIAAGAIVTKNVEPNAIVSSTAAKEIRKRRIVSERS